jgi:holo-[acyl-carrier protein] synthase
MLVGTGVDIIDIRRFRKVANKRGGRFLNRIFTTAELSYCDKKIDKIQHLAARFACKEAISKALKINWSKGLNWKEIEITNNRSGEPEARLTGQAKEVVDYLKIENISLSLSHCQDYAVAMAVILKGNHNGTYRRTKHN